MSRRTIAVRHAECGHRIEDLAGDSRFRSLTRQQAASKTGTEDHLEARYRLREAGEWLCCTAVQQMVYSRGNGIFGRAIAVRHPECGQRFEERQAGCWMP